MARKANAMPEAGTTHKLPAVNLQDAVRKQGFVPPVLGGGNGAVGVVEGFKEYTTKLASGLWKACTFLPQLGDVSKKDGTRTDSVPTFFCERYFGALDKAGNVVAIAADATNDKVVTYYSNRDERRAKFNRKTAAGPFLPFRTKAALESVLPTGNAARTRKEGKASAVPTAPSDASLADKAKALRAAGFSAAEVAAAL